MNDNVIIKFSNATISYQNRTAIRDVSLQIHQGEFVGIIGPNGSGKTTLLKSVLGLVRPTSGSVQIFDCACHKLRCSHKSKIGYIPQKGQIDYNFPVTVGETVMMGRYSSIGLIKRTSRKDKELVLEALREVEMDTYIESPLGHLSGGQQQRVFIARALVQQPEVLLMDEPTTGIDTPTQYSMIKFISNIHKNLKLTILLVTHDINMISPYVDRMALLKTKLYVYGTPAEVLNEKILTEIYGKQVIVTTKDSGTYVIAGDYHHHA
ncbi:MAG: metal ABC transporter ATP-binding protein [Nitrospirae bacterium]|nr:metal ABC transporter ATP-binding protein [Nitrospirota bacterium]